MDKLVIIGARAGGGPGVAGHCGLRLCPVRPAAAVLDSAAFTQQRRQTLLPRGGGGLPGGPGPDRQPAGVPELGGIRYLAVAPPGVGGPGRAL